MAKSNKKAEHKLVASSEREEYVKKINRRLDLRLHKDLHHYETEEKLFVKNFSLEFKKTREKLDKIRKQRKEFSSDVLSEGVSPDGRVFITDGVKSPESSKPRSSVTRR